MFLRGLGFHANYGRTDLLGHRSGRITTHYSAAEIYNLIKAANKICETKQDQFSSPTLTLLRCANAGSIPVQVKVGQNYENTNCTTGDRSNGSIAPTKSPQIDLGELSDYDVSHVH